MQEEDKRFDEEENQRNNNLIVEQFEDDDLPICYSDNHSSQLTENFDNADSIDSIDSADSLDTDIEHIRSEEALKSFYNIKNFLTVYNSENLRQLYSLEDEIYKGLDNSKKQ